MIQQVVVITPDTTQSAAEVLGFVRTTLPNDVIEYLNSCSSAGTRTTSVAAEDNVFTITTQLQHKLSQTLVGLWCLLLLQRTYNTS